MRYLYVFLLIGLSTWTACTPKDDHGLKIFKYNQASGITSLDPAFAKNQANIWAVSQMFNGLVQLDSDMNVAPAIAKSWRYSDDAKSISFDLREDVFFHDDAAFEKGSRIVTAHDFVYSFNRIIDPKTASPGAWIFNGKIAEQDPFVAIDDFTFQINLKQAFSPMLGILSMPYCFVVPKEVVATYGKDFRSHPVGTGPFVFKVWEEGTALVALKNENYFEQDSKGEQLPKVDGFKLTFIESKKMEYLNFMKNELDMLSGVDKSFVQEILEDDASLKAEWQDKINLYKAPFLNTEYLGFNLEGDNPWVKQKEFRQAINYCFDKEAMVKFLRRGVGFPALGGFIPKGLPPFNAANLNGYNFQPEKARALLAAINYDGSEVILSTNETYKDIALYIANEAEKVGLNLKIDVVQPSLLREWMVNGQVDFFRGSWIADYPDAENYLSLFYSGNGAPPNYTRFHNANFDTLYLEASKSTDIEQTLKLYQKMDSLLIEEAPVVFLYYDEIVRLTHSNISGAKPNALNALDIKYIKKD